MSRLLQVVIALVGLAITGVLGLASERSESLQSRHALIGLFTETVSAARGNCDQGLAAMAVGALQQLESLEANRFVLTPGDREDQENTQTLLANYQDYMAEVQGTIDAGGCRSGGAPLLASIDGGAPAGEGAGGGGATASLSPSVLARVRSESNMILRQNEQQVQMADQVQAAPAQPPPPADGAGPAPSASVQEEVTIERARVQLRLPVSGYYAVMASYAVTDAATYDSERGLVAHYRRLQQSVGAEGLNVSIFQTGATNLYAIVLTADGASRTDARRLVATARARGWSSGALVQPARDWTQCPAPERINRQGGCAGN